LREQRRILPASLFSLIAQAPVTPPPLLRCNRKSKGECENIAVNAGITPVTAVHQSRMTFKDLKRCSRQALDAVAMTVSA
jgi:hypothetical protein